MKQIMPIEQGKNSHYVITDDLGNFYAKAYSSYDAKLIAGAEDMKQTLEHTLNSIYALRDHAQEQGFAATVEQGLITEILTTFKKLEF